MLANEFIRLPYQFMGLVPPWVPRWGPEHKEFVRSAYQADHRGNGAGAGDAAVRCARPGGSGGQGSLGNSGGAPVRAASIRTPSKSRAFSRARREAWLKEAGAVQHLAARSRPGAQRRAAPGRHLPHGKRSEDIGGGQRLPDSRCGQRVRDRRQRARDQRRVQPGADHSGECLPRVRQLAARPGKARGCAHERDRSDRRADCWRRWLSWCRAPVCTTNRAAGARCTACHEMQTVYDQWHASSHRGIGVREVPRRRAHADASFHMNNAHRAVLAPARRSAGRDPVRQPLRAGDDRAMPELPPSGVRGVAVRSAQRQLRAHLPGQKAQHGEHADGRLPALPRHAFRRRRRAIW